MKYMQRQHSKSCVAYLWLSGLIVIISNLVLNRHSVSQILFCAVSIEKFKSSQLQLYYRNIT